MRYSLFERDLYISYISQIIHFNTGRINKNLHCQSALGWHHNCHSISTFIYTNSILKDFITNKLNSSVSMYRTRRFHKFLKIKIMVFLSISGGQGAQEISFENPVKNNTHAHIYFEKLSRIVSSEF